MVQFFFVLGCILRYTFATSCVSRTTETMKVGYRGSGSFVPVGCRGKAGGQVPQLKSKVIELRLITSTTGRNFQPEH